MTLKVEVSAGRSRVGTLSITNIGQQPSGLTKYEVLSEKGRGSSLTSKRLIILADRDRPAWNLVRDAMDELVRVFGEV